MNPQRTPSPNPPRTPSPVDIEMNRLMLIDLIMQQEFKFVKDSNYSIRKSELMNKPLDELNNIYLINQRSKLIKKRKNGYD